MIVYCEETIGTNLVKLSTKAHDCAEMPPKKPAPLPNVEFPEQPVKKPTHIQSRGNGMVLDQRPLDAGKNMQVSGYMTHNGKRSKRYLSYAERMEWLGGVIAGEVVEDIYIDGEVVQRTASIKDRILAATLMAKMAGELSDQRTIAGGVVVSRIVKRYDGSEPEPEDVR